MSLEDTILCAVGVIVLIWAADHFKRSRLAFLSTISNIAAAFCAALVVLSALMGLGLWSTTQ